MVEIEPVDRERNLLCQRVLSFLHRVRCSHPFLQLGLARDPVRSTSGLSPQPSEGRDVPVAIELVATANKRVEWALCVLPEEVHPHGIVARVKTGPAE